MVLKLHTAHAERPVAPVPPGYSLLEMETAVRAATVFLIISHDVTNEVETVFVFLLFHTCQFACR